MLLPTTKKGKIWISWPVYRFTTKTEWKFNAMQFTPYQNILYTRYSRFWSKKQPKVQGTILAGQALECVWVPAYRQAKKLCTICLNILFNGTENSKWKAFVFKGILNIASSEALWMFSTILLCGSERKKSVLKLLEWTSKLSFCNRRSWQSVKISR